MPTAEPPPVEPSEGQGKTMNTNHKNSIVIIKNVPKKVENDVIQKLCTEYGSVMKTETVGGPRPGLEDMKMVTITYNASDDAHEALKGLDGRNFEGCVLRAEMYSPYMRRSRYQSGPYQPQPRTAPELPLRLLVPSEMVGAIIGRKGESIRNITQKSGARIDVHRREAPGVAEKVVQINGTNEACSDACSAILKILQEGGDTEAAAGHPDSPLKMLSHSQLCGRLIGKDGAVIKRIIEETSTRINVTRLNCPLYLDDYNYADQLDRVIMVRGTHENIMLAETLVHSKLRQSYEADYHLMSSGHSGYMMHGGPPHGMMMNHPPPHHIAAAIQHANSFGHPPPSDMRAAPYGMMSRSAPYGQYGGPPPGPGYHNGQMNASQIQGGRSVSPHSSPMSNRPETATLIVPQVCVGAIIGTKGANIKKIQHVSGAQVMVVPAGEEITKSENRSVERQINIHGTPEAQWKAQFFIYDKVKSEEFFASDPQKPRCEISVPRSVVGHIIGRSGANVKALQKFTGAIIKLPEKTDQSPSNPPASDEVALTITGTFYSSQWAQRRIRWLVDGALEQQRRAPNWEQGASNASNADGDEPRGPHQRMHPPPSGPPMHSHMHHPGAGGPPPHSGPGPMPSGHGGPPPSHGGPPHPMHPPPHIMGMGHGHPGMQHPPPPPPQMIHAQGGVMPPQMHHMAPSHDHNGIPH